MTEVRQRDLAELFPAMPETAEAVHVGLHLIHDSPFRASAELRASMEGRGQLQPVILNGATEGQKYGVIDGRRRIAAARALGWSHINAIIHRVDPLVALSLAVTANAVRSDNPVTDIDGIVALMREGYDAKQIAAATGLGLSTVRKRMKLAALPDALISGVRHGKIAVGVAERIAGLPAAQQEELLARYTDTDRLTAADVDAVTRVAAETSVLALSDELFADPTPNPQSALDGLRAALGDLRRAYAGSVTFEEWMRATEEAWDDD